MVPVTTEDRAGAGRAVGRPSTSAPFEQRLAEWLAGEPAAPTTDLLRRAREIGYRGGKSAFYDLARRTRRALGRPPARAEAAPGVYTRHALARIVVDLEDDRGATIDVLASQLAWCGVVHVELAKGRGEDAVLRCLRATFAAFGGAPLATVWSGPRWIGRRGPAGETRWAPALAAEALASGFALLLDEAGRPASGAAQLAAMVKRRFFRARRFRERADVERELAAWLAQENAPRWPALAEERARLRPSDRYAAHRDA